jgi:hypothetical protein
VNCALINNKNSTAIKLATCIVNVSCQLCLKGYVLRCLFLNVTFNLTSNTTHFRAYVYIIFFLCFDMKHLLITFVPSILGTSCIQVWKRACLYWNVKKKKKKKKFGKAVPFLLFIRRGSELNFWHGDRVFRGHSCFLGCVGKSRKVPQFNTLLFPSKYSPAHFSLIIVTLNNVSRQNDKTFRYKIKAGWRKSHLILYVSVQTYALDRAVPGMAAPETFPLIMPTFDNAVI